MKWIRMAPVVVIAVLLVAAPAFAGITIEEFVLGDGRRAFALDGKLYLPGADGALQLSGDGRFALRAGGSLTVRAGRLLAPPRMRKVFDPQPEPPGIALRGALAGGEAIVLVGNRLFLVAGAERRLCPNGTYNLKGGASAQVVGGQLTGLGSLSGFSPGEVGAAVPAH